MEPAEGRRRRATAPVRQAATLALLAAPAYLAGWGPLALVGHLFLVVRVLHRGGLDAARRTLVLSGLVLVTAEALVADGVASSAVDRPLVHAVTAAGWLGLAWATHALAVDVSRRDRHERALLRRADHDPLTGLLNRQAFEDRVAAAITRAGDARVAVLFVDLDGFKGVNDRLGHAAGDTVLRTLAQRLAAVAPGALIGRQGGDEFAVVLPRIENLRAATTIANDIIGALEGAVLVDGELARVSCSVGIAVGDRCSEPWTLLRAADESMYRAKAAGGGRWEIASLRVVDVRDPGVEASGRGEAGGLVRA